MNTRTLFEEKLPKFTDTDAAVLFHEHGEIVSVAGRKGPLDFFLVKFVSKNGLFAGPLTLNPVVARALCAQLLAAGYGPR
jgi:hypothetical protein